MSETLAPSQITSQHIVNLAAASLSAAADLTEAERTLRSRTVIDGTAALQPIDLPQTMLASLILSHHLAIMDGFRDIARQTLTPAEAARARMVTVAQTRLVLQMVREMRLAREEAQAQTIGRIGSGSGAAVPSPAGDTGADDTLAKFMSAYTETVATLRNDADLTPESVAKARETLNQRLSPALFVPPMEKAALAPTVTGSRAQRRAMMKRRGQFKRTA